ncbi:hypothetical protein [Halostella litorea]|uniref:hypothetical protein n=1 Tax=Halostella litorea TaxID=2528831 RepID=UPI00138768EB|nr:hypothetical protein [Halostella litorea]
MFTDADAVQPDGDGRAALGLGEPVETDVGAGSELGEARLVVHADHPAFAQVIPRRRCTAVRTVLVSDFSLPVRTPKVLKTYLSASLREDLVLLRNVQSEDGRDGI